MRAIYFRYQDWVIGILGLLLIIDLRKLPWFSGSSETISAVVLTHPSSTGTASPNGWVALLAAFATVLAILDLVVERLAPERRIPALGGSRATTRYVLAVVAAVLLAVKFILHVGRIGDLGVGFWLGAALAAAFVYCTASARARAEEGPARRYRARPADRKRTRS
jgi:hypothetical protein